MIYPQVSVTYPDAFLEIFKGFVSYQQSEQPLLLLLLI